MTGGSSSTDVSAIWSAFWKGCSRLLLKEAPQAWNGPDQARFRSEREKILTHLKPIGMGLVTTAFCFASFRISGSRWWIKVRENYFRLSITEAPSSVSTPNLPKGHLAREAESKQEKIRDLVQVPLDFMLSVLLGSSAFFILFDSEKLQDDLIQIPLLPGRSLVHQCVCPDVVRAVREHHNDLNIDEETQRFFKQFAENCQKRSRYLEQRHQFGIPSPELVPYPGLQGRITR